MVCPEFQCRGRFAIAAACFGRKHYCNFADVEKLHSAVVISSDLALSEPFLRGLCCVNGSIVHWGLQAVGFIIAITNCCDSSLCFGGIEVLWYYLAKTF